MTDTRWQPTDPSEPGSPSPTGSHGLTSAEAAARLGRVGRNELREAARRSRLSQILAQFASPLVALLLVATVISLAVWYRDRATPVPYEALAIFAVVVLNAAMGFLQESRAEAAIDALRTMAARRASVIRDGRRSKVPAAEIVPGDVLVVEEGDTVAADARVVEAVSLQAMEAALTGESLPVRKSPGAAKADAPLAERADMLFGGTTVTYGHGRALVVATGMETEMGRIATLIERTPRQKTPMQVELARTARRLGVAVLVIAVVVIAGILLLAPDHALGTVADALLVGVALAVAAVPEGLPAIITTVLSIGTSRMAKRNAIVRHLAAVEALGSATVIASDKTGTLTENRMAVRAIITAEGRHSLEDVNDATPDAMFALTIGDRVNNATLPAEGPAHGDPTEIALREAARDAGVEDDEIDRQLPRLAELPFSSARRMMSTIHRVEADGGTVVFTKGAPDVIIARCATERLAGRPRALTAARRAEILAAGEGLAGEAMRMIAVASRRLEGGSATHPADLAAADVEQDLELAGIIGMTDPPRPAAKAAVARAKSGGIRPLMITGDHPRTAAIIARELGIGDGETVLTGPELDRMADHDLDEATARAAVFARVSPEHKLRIVESLRRRREVVAMTGDGVNDAPALKSADIGIAMGRGGTDAAREASDIVLADDNFATIVAAVEEGRAIYANIRKFLRYLLSSNIGEVLTMFLGMVFARAIGLAADDGTFAVPLLATQILWINLVTDGPPALALGVEPADPDLMRMPPRGRTESVITPAMWRGIFLVGLVMALATLAVIDASLPGGFIAGSGTLGHARTMGFMTLMLAQLFNVFNARSDSRSAFGGGRPAAWLWASLAFSLGLQAAVVHLPALQRAFGTERLSASDWGVCLLAASSVLAAREAEKAVRRRRLRIRDRTPGPAR